MHPWNKTINKVGKVFKKNHLGLHCLQLAASLLVYFFADFLCKSQNHNLK